MNEAKQRSRQRRSKIESMTLADEPCPDCGSQHHRSCKAEAPAASSPDYRTRKEWLDAGRCPDCNFTFKACICNRKIIPNSTWKFCGHPVYLGTYSCSCTAEEESPGAPTWNDFLTTLLQPLKDACDRDWKDETPEQVVTIAANAIYWRDRELIESRAIIREWAERINGIYVTLKAKGSGSDK